MNRAGKKIEPYIVVSVSRHAINPGLWKSPEREKLIKEINCGSSPDRYSNKWE